MSDQPSTQPPSGNTERDPRKLAILRAAFAAAESAQQTVTILLAGAGISTAGYRFAGNATIGYTGIPMPHTRPDGFNLNIAAGIVGWMATHAHGLNLNPKK